MQPLVLGSKQGAHHGFVHKVDAAAQIADNFRRCRLLARILLVRPAVPRAVDGLVAATPAGERAGLHDILAEAVGSHRGRLGVALFQLVEVAEKALGVEVERPLQHRADALCVERDAVEVAVYAIVDRNVDRNLDTGAQTFAVDVELIALKQRKPAHIVLMVDGIVLRETVVLLGKHKVSGREGLRIRNRHVLHDVVYDARVILAGALLEERTFHDGGVRIADVTRSLLDCCVVELPAVLVVEQHVQQDGGTQHSLHARAGHVGVAVRVLHELPHVVVLDGAATRFGQGRLNPVRDGFLRKSPHVGVSLQEVLQLVPAVPKEFTIPVNLTGIEQRCELARI